MGLGPKTPLKTEDFVKIMCAGSCGGASWSRPAQYRGATRGELRRGERSGERRAVAGYGFSLLNPAPSCPSFSSSYSDGSTSRALVTVVPGLLRVSCLQAAEFDTPFAIGATPLPFEPLAVPFGTVPCWRRCFYEFNRLN